MKFVVFGIALMLGVPLMTLVDLLVPKARVWLFAALVFTTVLGDHGNVHLVSLEWYRGPDRGFEVTLTDLIALAMALSLVVRRPARLAWWPYNSGPMLLFFAVACLSAVGSLAPDFSLFTLWKILRAGVLYWVVLNLARTGLPLKGFWRALVALAAFLAGYAFYQKYGQGYYRVPTTFAHSNTVPLFINQVLPLLLAWGLVARAPWKAILSLGGALAMLFTVVMTFSRAGMVFSLLTVLGLLWYANRRARSPRITIATAVVIGGLGLGGALMAGSIVERFREAPEASRQARDQFNAVADQMAGSRLFGVGINQFSMVGTETPGYRKALTVMANEPQVGVCHHVWRLTAAETGWPGLVIFVWVLLRLLWRSGREALRRRGEEGLAFAALTLGALAIHLGGFYEWVFRTTPIYDLFTICAALAMGLADRLELDRRSLQVPSR